jgi:nitrate/TMAO reductase-like tetraheme cytochrome c subunit
MEEGQRRRLWRRPWSIVIVAAVVIVVLAVASMAVAAKYTESNHFCANTCHEMNVYGSTWQHSKHSNISCVHCHIGPGTWNFLKAKFYGLREVWVHITGGNSKPIAVTRHVPNSVCAASGCHPASKLAQPVQLFTASFNHAGHTKVPVCIDCHAQVVHNAIPNVAYIPPQSMAKCFTCHSNAGNKCDYCHKPPHGPRGGRCTDCHNVQSWGGKNFSHPQPLVGTHAAILCEQCHTNGIGQKPAGCINCHGDQHNGLLNCVDCHVLAHFVPSTFKHPQEGPHIPAGDEPIPCNACHAQGFGQKASCPCHGGKPPTGGG